MINHQKRYHASKAMPIIQMVANLVKKNPSLADNPAYLLATLQHNIPDFDDRSKCINCGASMVEYVQTLDIHDALLLYSMAKLRLEITGFNEANKIHVSGSAIPHTQQCRTTKASKLGLIAKAGNNEWAITDRGWSALRGEPVPKVRVTFRGQILERPEEMTTLRAVFAEHRAKMESLQIRNKSLKNDQRGYFATYNQSDWVTVGGIHQGVLA